MKRGLFCLMTSLCAHAYAAPVETVELNYLKKVSHDFISNLDHKEVLYVSSDSKESFHLTSEGEVVQSLKHTGTSLFLLPDLSCEVNSFVEQIGDGGVVKKAKADNFKVDCSLTRLVNGDHLLQVKTSFQPATL